MERFTSRVQYFHLQRPPARASLPRLAYQSGSLETRKVNVFHEPATAAAIITVPGIPGVLYRLPGQHPVDTRWAAVDPDYAFSLALDTDSGLGQEEMRAMDDAAAPGVKIREIKTRKA